MRRLRAGFAGRLTAAGDSLVGEWRQSGLAMPLALGRTGKAPELRRPQDPRPPYAYDTLEVAYPNPAAPGVTLAGTLTTPRGPGPFPCAVLITGSGPEDRDEAVFGHRPFRVLADHLTRAGIAVLRADDRGVGKSTGKFSTATSEDFASDVLAGIEFLRGRHEIDRRRIGLIGHSEGGLIAPMVATRSRQTAFIVMMAGPGLPGDSILMLQSAAMRRTIGVSEEAIGREMAVSRRMYALLRGGDSAGVAVASRELVRLQLAALPEAQREAAGDPDKLAAGALRQLLSPWMRFFATYDPRPALSRLACPVLAINGSKDLQVPPRENLAAIRAALEAGRNRDFTVKALPGLNHLFQTCETGGAWEYAQIEETIAPAALKEMSDWILGHAGPKR